jgi:hypothetical protein
MPVGRLTQKSKFRIDLAYWEERGRSFREELYGMLCEDCKQLYPLEDYREVDHVDPLTGEVTRMDALLECASGVCAESPDFINPKMPLTSAIFRAFVAAGNAPQSAEDIYARIKKGSPQVILKELTSLQMEDVGITPV